MKFFCLLMLVIGVIESPALHAAETDNWFGFDKKLHFGASALVSGYGYGMSSMVLELPWQRAVAGASIGLGAGIGKELIDLAGLGGQASWRDLTWDIAGIAVGISISLLLDYLLEAIFPTQGRFRATPYNEVP